METIPIIYKNLCPNCESDISGDRLSLGLTCENCLPNITSKELLCKHLTTLKNFKETCFLKSYLKEFEETFFSAISFEMSSIQRMWATRFFLNNSFALIAPTGIGKTTFGLVLSEYIAKKDLGFVYLIFPTNILVKQAKERLIKYGVSDSDIIAYESDLPKSTLNLLKSRIKDGDFKILITTTNFLSKNFDIIPKGIYSLVFVDDVDSILKRSKNIDRVLGLLNFSEEDLKETLNLIAKKLSILKEANKEKLLDLDKKLSEINDQLENIRKKRKGVLVVSSATANPKSSRVKLFKELLNFEVGKFISTLRSVVDSYKITDNLEEDAVKIIKEHGRGGLIFLNSDYTKAYLDNFVQFLNKQSIKAVSYEKLSKHLKDFEEGKIDVFVGFSTSRNPLTRGIDLPHVIKYALFLGVPKIRFKIAVEESPSGLYYAILALLPHIIRKKIFDAQTIKRIQYSLNILRRISIVNNKELSEKEKEAIDYIRSLLSNPTIEELIKSVPEISLKKEASGLTFIVVDFASYIQASGRTSRLIVTGLTKGLSIILTNDEKSLFALEKKLKWFLGDVNFYPYDNLDIKTLKEEIENDRTKAKNILQGKSEFLPKKLFKTSLVIVESPNKARTIASFYGKPLKRTIGNLDAYEVIMKDSILTIVASKGHVCDLNKVAGYFGVLKEGDVFIPLFEPIDENKKSIINSLRRLSLEVEEVLLATDPDTEGEKISYDIFLNLMPYNSTIKRTEFHEVTKTSFENAVKNYRSINLNLVKAQLLRRISDRFIGFVVSKYVQKVKNMANLSSGRVQTPVLEWIVERFNASKEKSLYLVVRLDNGFKVQFNLDKKPQKEDLEKLEVVKANVLRTFEESSFKTPFETYTLLREAASRLRFPLDKTMKLAQDLFELGLITYHRTDSIRVSDAGVSIAKEYIKEHFGEEYIKIRTFSHLEGAHECIRPTKAMDGEDLRSFIYLENIEGLTIDHIKLYDLIFRQFIASQMKEAVIEKSEVEFTATIKDETLKENEVLNTSIKEDGYNLILPIEIFPLKDTFNILDKNILSLSKTPPYTHSSIVEEMKEKGIGRPSTYAITIEKLIKRKYVIEKSNYLIPTKLGIEVINIVKANKDIAPFVSESYTRELEGKMDLVELGQLDYNKEILNVFENLVNIEEFSQKVESEE